VAAPPGTICTTPGGKPESAKSWPSAKAPSGDFSDALNINWQDY
jgi:hypothetical protein